MICVSAYVLSFTDFVSISPGVVTFLSFLSEDLDSFSISSGTISNYLLTLLVPRFTLLEGTMTDAGVDASDSLVGFDGF